MGVDSYETAALVVRYAVTQGLTFTHTAIVTGATFADGLGRRLVPGSRQRYIHTC